MPKFYFDVWDESVQVPDLDGTNCADRMEARNEAMEILSDLGRLASSHGDRRTFVVNVRDERRVMIYSATLAVAGRWLAN